ncbi:MAG: adenosylmethionine--8-amino-7-oxononanoate transaminase [Candidatus Omnitrophica bacterium]|nr:adenosylmethionine--8-amino-7-oxononanoate transaminase [Candidatus Omnitrophota bacterium]MDD5488879.1 adenosylmethionine--8-amino-7-oxononanoate transaminase [Candidatus Omnitrophota bacterium]
MVNSADLARRDIEHVWHPYTQMKDCEKHPPIPIRSAKGVRLYDHDGKFYYDTISSWWCNVHGHGHPAIVRAIQEQAQTLEHVLFAGFTHEPAIECAEKLVSILPAGLGRIFYSDNGSTAVEVAMKMSFQYWQNTGSKKKMRFLALDMAYHGDTIGAMSVSGVDLFNQVFAPLFLDALKVPTPYCYRCPVGCKAGSCSMECADIMERTVRDNSEDLAAVIIEPLLMGAGGMIVYPEEYLRRVRKVTAECGVHLIADEVATGFGRTGSMFACGKAGIAPDIMCLSKGITSGYLPMGVTATTEDIFNAFYDDHENKKTFYHGHTFTANPIACAAASASMRILMGMDVPGKVEAIRRRLSGFLDSFGSHPLVGDIRGIGVVGAMELVKDRDKKTPFGIKERIGLDIYTQGLSDNLVLRPLGNIIYFFLPISITEEEMSDMFGRAHKAISKVLDAWSKRGRGKER